MKLAVAQLKPTTGDIEKNISHHLAIVEMAISKRTSLIVFPELSLTGYEPSLANSLAIDPLDARLQDFQSLSDRGNITVGVGVPTRGAYGVLISIIFFQPNRSRQVYSKRYLHPDEEPFFVPGDNLNGLMVDNKKVSFAICYEISIPEHTRVALADGAQFYVASVAKFLHGIEKANMQLRATAKAFSVPVLMSNAIGPSDGGECAGQSSIWDGDGILRGQFDGIQQGILVLDTATNTCGSYLL
jgi:predicted amidohydrolase